MISINMVVSRILIINRYLFSDLSAISNNAVVIDNSLFVTTRIAPESQINTSVGRDCVTVGEIVSPSMYNVRK